MLPTIIPEAVRVTLRKFPPEIRDKLGFALYQLQEGRPLSMPLSRPMPSVGKGVSEIRVKDASGQYRVFYVVVTLRGVLVLHAFKKTSRSTPESEVELGRRRLKELLR